MERVTQLIVQTGASVRFLPPYSPDLNPVEQIFSKVKTVVKKHDQLFQIFSALKLLLTMAFSTVTESDCKAYVKFCGYM